MTHYILHTLYYTYHTGFSPLLSSIFSSHLEIVAYHVRWPPRQVGVLVVRTPGGHAPIGAGVELVAEHVGEGEHVVLGEDMRRVGDEKVGEIPEEGGEEEEAKEEK